MVQTVHPAEPTMETPAKSTKSVDQIGPMHAFIRDQVSSEIREKSLSPGARLLTVREVAERFGVGVQTAARAYKLLEQDGIVVMQNRRGVFVAPEAHAVDTEEILLCLHPAFLNRNQWRAFERLRGVMRAAERRGAKLTLVTDGRAFDLRALNAPRTGVILFDPDYEADGFGPLADQAASLGRPCCIISTKDARFPGAPTQRSERFRLLVAHLATLGHRRIAMLNVTSREDRKDQGVTVGERNREGYLRGMAQAKLPALAEYYVEKPDPEASGPAGTLEGVDLLLSRDPLPTAIICNNDERARLVLDVLRARGIRVPQDISVAGCDNLPDCQRMDPPLTSVDTRWAAYGEAAVDYVLKSLHGETTRFPNIMPRVVPRASTASPGAM